MDIMLIILMIILGIFFIFISQYLIEKNGIINVYLIYNIVSFLLSFKILEVFEININSNIILSSLFTMITYLLVEKLSIKEYKNLIKQTFTINIFLSIGLLISSFYIGSVNDINSVNMQNIFLNNYKILISYPIVTLINQILILLMTNIIKESIKNINIRIIITNLTILMIETILFYISSYIFTGEFNYLLVLIISNYLIKVIITSLYTPFISYLISLKKVRLWMYYY